MKNNKIYFVLGFLILVNILQCNATNKAQSLNDKILQTNEILIKQNDAYKQANVDLTDKVTTLQNKVNSLMVSNSQVSNTNNIDLNSSIDILKGFELGIEKGKLKGQLLTKEQIETSATIEERKKKSEKKEIKIK